MAPFEKSSQKSLLGQLAADLAAAIVEEPVKIHWSPNAGPQRLALESEADEIWYGGQAGGGKTDFLIGKAIVSHRKSYIFRREFKQLKDIIDRAKEIIGNPNWYHVSDHIWRLPNGQRIEFGSVEHAGDEHKYQGRAGDFKAFDEVTHFLEKQFLYLSGWNRSTVPGQKCQVACTFNPPDTEEGQWVIDRLAPWLDKGHSNPARPGELRWFVRIDDKDTEVDGPDPIEYKGEVLRPRSRTFIPAALSDNPHLAGTDYEAVLDQLPEPLRSQLKHGDFGIGHGDDPWCVFPATWLKAAVDRWKATEPPTENVECLGVDVARGGKDNLAIEKRTGTYFHRLVVVPGLKVGDGPTLVARVLEEYEPGAKINIDVISVGSSPYDILKAQGYDVEPINNAEREIIKNQTDRSGKLKFANVRAFTYWKLREALDPIHGDGLALPDDPELMREMKMIRWSVGLSGIQIEKKDDFIDRFGRSPDRMDAVVLAAAIFPKKEFKVFIGDAKEAKLGQENS